MLTMGNVLIFLQKLCLPQFTVPFSSPSLFLFSAWRLCFVILTAFAGAHPALIQGWLHPPRRITAASIGWRSGHGVSQDAGSPSPHPAGGVPGAGTYSSGCCGSGCGTEVPSRATAPVSGQVCAPLRAQQPMGHTGQRYSCPASD